jgi:hypothetical protein
VTNPLRTIVDLAAVLPADGVEDAIDTGLAWPSLFSIPAIESMRDEIARRGRAGAGVLAAILGIFLAEVDFAYPDLRLAIEVDGFGVHGTPRAMAKDFVRQNGLVPYGWHVLRFTWRQVVREPEMVARAIAGALAGLAAA